MSSYLVLIYFQDSFAYLDDISGGKEKTPILVSEYLEDSDMIRIWKHFGINNNQVF